MIPFPNIEIPLLIASFCVIIGFFGAFLPIVPACVMIWLGFIVHKLAFADHSFSWFTIIIMTALMVTAQVIDWVCTYWGVKKFGGTWRGGLGAIAGLIIGPIVASIVPGIGTLIGIILGPVLGAFLAELAAGMHWLKAHKAAFGTIVGGLIAYIARILIALTMVISFIILTFQSH